MTTEGNTDKAKAELVRMLTLAPGVSEREALGDVEFLLREIEDAGAFCELVNKLTAGKSDKELREQALWIAPPDEDPIGGELEELENMMKLMEKAAPGLWNKAESKVRRDGRRVALLSCARDAVDDDLELSRSLFRSLARQVGKMDARRGRVDD